MSQNIFNTDRDIIISMIEQIIYKGSNNNFVIFNFNSDFYVQIAAARGDYEIYCEAISDNHLEEDILLTQEQKDRLKNLGWNDPIGSEGNYYLTHTVDSELTRKELAELLLKTINQVYDYEDIDLNAIILNLE